METIYEFFESRAALIPTGDINEPRVYNAYCNFARQRGVEPVSIDAIRTYIHFDIWKLKLWWGQVSFHNWINAHYIVTEEEYVDIHA